ncbi:MAG: hypothetical protein E6I43_13010 [Chloroflexi bacterium]|nr:MAG: hypothetical protein E6I43_13010 [Chloroflexota bacterium]
MLLRFNSLLGLVSSLLISVKPLGAPQLWVAEPWLTPKPARTISLAAVVAAPALTDRLLTAVVALLADPVVSRVSVAPTSATVYETLVAAESVTAPNVVPVGAFG